MCQEKKKEEDLPTSKSIRRLKDYIKKSKGRLVILVMLATLVEGDPKAPLSIATTPRYREGCYFFPWITPLYSWSVPYIAES